VIGIEKDEKVYKNLSRKFQNGNKAEIKYGDFLKYPLPKDKKYKVFLNIPFNLIADIIAKLNLSSTHFLDTYSQWGFLINY